MTSSLRVAALADTLAMATSMAKQLGIVRVTDTTRLDRLGIPVFASVRPDSRSLCVNAGKGVHPDEARVGAYMEAIEFALGEFRHSNLEIVMSSPRAVQSQPGAEFDFVDLCPVLGRPVDPDGPLACVRAEDIRTGGTLLVPAELVFSPFPENPGQQIFGTSTNGLCSGNSTAEATLHGLCELVERDVRSFNYVRDDSALVEFDDPGPDLAGLRQKLDDADLQVAVRYSASPLGLPYFDCFLLEPIDELPVAISHGAGLHPVTGIAAVRAVTEAAQARLSWIHGGRDDLTDRHDYLARRAERAPEAIVADSRARVLDATRRITYSHIPDPYRDLVRIEDALTAVTAALHRQGIRQVLRVTLSAADAPLQVLRVIAPGLEAFRPTLQRVGTRLARFIADEQAS